MFKNKNYNEEGFTLIELLVVIIIIGLLAAIALPIFLNQRQAAAYSALQSDIKNLSTIAMTHKTKTGKYPATCNEWQTVLPGSWKSDSTSAIGTRTSPDGMSLWIEGQATGFSSGQKPNAEVDAYTAIYNSNTGKGIQNRVQYMQERNISDRTTVSQVEGYTNVGLKISELTNCSTW